MAPTADLSPTIAYDEFLKVDIRVGTIVSAEGFPQARQARVQACHRFRSDDRKKEILGADHYGITGRTI